MNILQPLVAGIQVTLRTPTILLGKSPGTPPGQSVQTVVFTSVRASRVINSRPILPSIVFQQLFHSAFDLQIASLSRAFGIVHYPNIGLYLGPFQELARPDLKANLGDPKE